MTECKILIVNDHFSSRFLLAEICSGVGAKYAMASDGQQAIDLMKAQDFAMVFMDIEMPVMNGYETTRHIRFELPAPKSNTPIIAVTAHDPRLFRQEYHQVEFDDVVLKPYSIKKVRKVIRKFCPSLQA